MPPHECPTCGIEFDSRRGLGVHHSSVHEKRLPNRTCDRCDEEFFCEYEKRYCSDDCHDEAISYEGESNPNFRGGKTETTCVLCEQEFKYYRSEKEGLYCSDCVQNASWRDPPIITGSDHPRWNGGKLTFSCDVCDATVERHPSGVTGEAILCGRDCLEEWLSETFTGDGHPNWRGGGNEAYGSGWNPVRERALERDGYACVVCEADAESLGRNPDVHHLIPVRVFVQSALLTVDDAHTLDNVVSLCPSCHRQAEFGHLTRGELRWRAGLSVLSGPAASRHSSLVAESPA